MQRQSQKKMSKTFSSRRVEEVSLSPSVSVFKERWPALFSEAQVRKFDNFSFHKELFICLLKLWDLLSAIESFLYCSFIHSLIKEEFRRIMTISLEETFMLQLDRYTPCLLQLMFAKGGAARSKMRPLLDTVNEVWFCFCFLNKCAICDLSEIICIQRAQRGKSEVFKNMSLKKGFSLTCKSLTSIVSLFTKMYLLT